MTWEGFRLNSGFFILSTKSILTNVQAKLSEFDGQMWRYFAVILTNYFPSISMNIRETLWKVMILIWTNFPCLSFFFLLVVDGKILVNWTINDVSNTANFRETSWKTVRINIANFHEQWQILVNCSFQLARADTNIMNMPHGYATVF